MNNENVKNVTEVQRSEVSFVLQNLQDKTKELKSTLETLEIRLQPILPEEKNVSGMEETLPSGDFCPLSKAIVNASRDVSDAIMFVNTLLKEIRI